jgi:alpha-L-arabinofuranosidase
MNRKHNFTLLISFLFAAVVAAQTTISVDFKKPGAPVQSTMYGIFFEDINYGADGGLYAELIKNRSFDFPQNLMGWRTFGDVSLQKDGPFERNPHYVRLSYPGHDHKHTGIENEGFFGIPLKKDEEYRFSVWARISGSTQQETIRIEFIDENNHAFQRENITFDSKTWKKTEFKLKANRTIEKARLRIFLTSKGALDMEHVSLFPVDTWKGRGNGMRKDLAQALYDLKPGVFRFPGGCIVEGTDLKTRYDWKKSVGPVENRELNENRWHYTFTHRFFPDYFQSYGLGFYEYFLLSKDFGAEPIPIVSVGLACQFQNECCAAHVPVGDLQDYIQDALDLIEFANGDVGSTWGKVRAEMGHPEPFNLKFIGVGNEQWGPEYPERLEKFITAIRTKYPKIKIIGSSGPGSEGKDFEYLWPEMKRLKVDLVDEHFYRPESWFLAQGARYDNYDRKGPKVFAGEYACHPRNRKNNFESALMEAAFMTGMERNADIVHMTTYAPLFAHYEGWQWRPDLIWFDNLRTVKSINYYVQQLYGHNPGTHVLKTLAGKTALTGQDGLFASSVVDRNKGEIILKIANTSKEPKKVQYNIAGLKKGERSAVHTVLRSDNPDIENTRENPEAVVPVSKIITLPGNVFDLELEAFSFHVVVVKI